MVLKQFLRRLLESTLQAPTSRRTLGSHKEIHKVRYAEEFIRIALFAELDVLRRRIFELEKLPSRIATLEQRLTPSRANEQLDQPESRNFAHQVPTNLEQDAATTLEFLALGVDRRGELANEPSLNLPNLTSPPGDPPMNILHNPFEIPYPDSVPAALLPLNLLQIILDYTYDSVVWQHACFHVPTFKREVAAFVTCVDLRNMYTTDRTTFQHRLSFVDPPWLALLLATCSIALQQMGLFELGLCGISKDQQTALIKSMFEACMTCMNISDYLAKPCLTNLQTIAMLAVCGHSTVTSNLMSSLLAIGLKSAQSLNLHRLGKSPPKMPASLLAQPSNMSTAEQIKDLKSHRKQLIIYEMSKRVWWSLVSQDWYQIPLRDTWTIQHTALQHFDTPFPNNCYDEDLDQGLGTSQGDDVLTIVLYVFALDGCYEKANKISVRTASAVRFLRSWNDTLLFCTVPTRLLASM